MEEHTSTERAGCPWGVRGISISGESEAFTPIPQAYRPPQSGKGELQETSWNATSSKAGKGLTLYAKKRAWLSQGPYPCVLIIQGLVPATWDSSRNRGRGRQLSRVGRGNSTLQRGSVFLLTVELSTHPVPSRIPLSVSPASVPKRSMDLTMGEQTSQVGSETLQQTQQVSSLLRKPCCLAGNKNLDCRQCLPGR